MLKFFKCQINALLIHILAPTRTTTKSPSAISKPVANVKATVNSGGGDNGAKIAELTQQVWMQSKAACFEHLASKSHNCLKKIFFWIYDVHVTFF